MEELFNAIAETSPYKKVLLLIALQWVCIGIATATTGFGLILTGLVTFILIAYITKIIK
jgi:hypothetical protein